MTRGTLYLVTPNGLTLRSTEYNGDMYLTETGDYTSWGVEAVKGLKQVNSVLDFTTFLSKFTEDYGYEEEEGKAVDITKYVDEDPKFWDMTTDYFEKFFSDYIFIKNLSDEVIEIRTKRSEIFLHKGETIVLCFGEYDEDCQQYSSEGIRVEVSELVLRKIKDLGWIVRDLGNQYEIENSSPAGEDLCEYINKADILKSVQDIANGFDPDEHARMWIVDAGHGQPIHIRDIIDDADAIAEMYDQLLEVVQ